MRWVYAYPHLHVIKMKLYGSYGIWTSWLLFRRKICMVIDGFIFHCMYFVALYCRWFSVVFSPHCTILQHKMPDIAMTINATFANCTESWCKCCFSFSAILHMRDCPRRNYTSGCIYNKISPNSFSSYSNVPNSPNRVQIMNN